jgi:hypothetical protein
MNFYFLYDLPNWLFASVIILFFVSFGLIGLVLTRKVIKRLHHADQAHNDIVSYYLAAMTVFYGITLGLVAAGTWNTYSGLNNKVDEEAQVVASIYRDVRGYPDTLKTKLQHDLKNYVDNVIHVSWPMQRKGLLPTQSGLYLDTFQTHLMSYSPQNIRDQVLEAEVFRQFNNLVETRRSRINSTHTGLPAVLWTLVVIGGLVCIVVSWFFDVKSFAMHVAMTILLSGLLGLMIYLIGTMDNPFRGKISVTPAALEMLYHQMIKRP